MSSLINRVGLRVRGYHLDGYGHVNNARYLEFMEEGRWSYFDQHARLVSEMHDSGRAFVVVNLNIDYKRAAVQNDDLTVMTGLIEVGERSALCHHRILRADGKVVAQADLTFVLMDMNAGRASTIDGEILETMKRIRVAKTEFAL
ncbi:thioesterase family protein [Halomonas sp. PAMB 3264]|uniref:acyl-CoA thioesterase n=1 Tax=Halomonas sp. PAMB 3264 TaxID=3075222 RepID=UPI0028A0BBEC|nr:thioesterase family protein [Halomonas sp. PAMB 3264]WNL40677.1 thioesterase family protein [Halomonas sp. PAMB 3264]